jgi:mevalonate kinase
VAWSKISGGGLGDCGEFLGLKIATDKENILYNNLI